MPAWARLHPKARCLLLGWWFPFHFFSGEPGLTNKACTDFGPGLPAGAPHLAALGKPDRSLSWLQKFHQVLQPQEAGVGN